MLKKLLGRWLNIRHVFVVTVIYRNKDHKEVFRMQNFIGLEEQSDILKRRLVVKSTTIESTIANIPPYLLKNGYVEFMPNAYLGWLKIPQLK